MRTAGQMVALLLGGPLFVAASLFLLLSGRLEGTDRLIGLLTLGFGVVAVTVGLAQLSAGRGRPTRARWLAREWAACLAAFFLALTFLVAAIMLAQQSASPHARLALALGFAGGLVPIMAELALALRRGTLFIRDRAEVERRRERNARWVAVLSGPSIALGASAAAFPALLAVVLLSAASGYVLPWSLLLIAHLWRNHREIRLVADG